MSATATSDLVGRTLSVDVPATTANLGAGFDALAMALDRASRFDLEVRSAAVEPRVEIEVVGEGAGQLPTDGRNRFVSVLAAALAEGGVDPTALGWRVRMDNDIPVARGLGSSASATIAALVAADELLGRGSIGPDRMLELAVVAEGHADNAAAALHGGFCVVTRLSGRLHCVRLDPPRALRCALFIPDRPLSTARMRAALPPSVPFDDAVHNVGAASLAVAAAATGDAELLATAADDRLHEPYRAEVYPELPELIAAARAAGAGGACLSGAGSTVIAFTADEASARAAADAMASRAAGVGIGGRSVVHAPRARGAIVLNAPAA